jgi:hypothetical protein
MIRCCVQILRGRLGQCCLLAALIAASAAAWRIWPQFPDVRCRFPSPGEYPWTEVAPDGRTFLLGTAGELSCSSDGRDATRLEVFELPEGISRSVVTDETRLRCVLCAPGGRRLAIEDSGGHWQLRALPSGDLIATLPTETTGWGYWSPDGRRFLVEGGYHPNKQFTIIDAKTGTLVAMPPRGFTQCMFIPDGSGLVIKDKDQTLQVWSFDLLRIIDSITPEDESPDDGQSLFDRPKGKKFRLGEIASNRDGSTIAALCSYVDGEFHLGIDTVKFSIGWWDRQSHRWHEVIDHPVYDGPGTLRFSADGRYVTRSNMRRYICGLAASAGARPDPPARELNLFDLASRPARCCNDFGFPEGGNIVFDPTARRIVHENDDNLCVFDSANLAPILRQSPVVWSDTVRCDRTGAWMSAKVSRRHWLPASVPEWIRERFDPAAHSYRVYSLGDGSRVCDLPGRDKLTFTSDGSLWTMTVSPTKTNDAEFDVVVERWSLHPSQPWWLATPPFAGACWLAWDVFRVRRKRCIDKSIPAAA